MGLVLSILGAAIAAGLAGIGSARGINIASRVGTGVLSEDPAKFGSTFLLVVLPSTQGFYGFVIAIFILFKVGVFGKLAPLTLANGLHIFFASLPVGAVGLLSAIYQGQVSAAGIELVAKRPTELMKGVIYAVMVETYAVLAFLVSFLMIFLGVKV